MYIKINIYSPVDTACHGFDLDCVAKAGQDILGDGARIAGNGDELYISTLQIYKKTNIDTDQDMICHRINHDYPFLGVGNTGYGTGYGYQGVDQGYVTRKELVKSGLLLGAGILKGALLTTVINNINNNNNGK